VALSDPAGILASPYTVIECRDEVADIKAITDIISQQGVARVIVGLPRSMDGSLGRQAEKVRLFTKRLSQSTSVPVEFRDERLTTVMAERLTPAPTRKKARMKPRRDAQAAALILQGYLEEERELRPPGCERATDDGL
jgi:putative Holliday junction resolvase